MSREWALGLVIASMAAVEGRSSGADAAREAARFQEIKWTVTRSLKEVNPEIVRALKVRFGRDDRLADHGGPFEASDVVSGKPQRRLVLAGWSGRRWFVAYEVGGRSHHLVLAVLDVAMPPQVVMVARGQAGVHDDASEWELDLEDVRDGLRTKRLYLENPAEPYY